MNRSAFALVGSILMAILIAMFGCLKQQSDTPSSASPRADLERHTWQNSCPGGALQHTPFHDGHTTRFLILKSCVKSEVLATHLNLSADQLERVRGLDELDDNEYSESIGISKLYDEEVSSPEYYSFLSDAQKDKLDALSFRLDGFVSLLRISMQSKIGLSNESTQKIAALFSKFRQEHTNPRMRRNFAAQLPDDIKYEDCWWDGSTTTYVNTKILAILSDEECKNLREFLDANSQPEHVGRELRKICELPDGVGSMFEYTGGWNNSRGR